MHGIYILLIDCCNTLKYVNRPSNLFSVFLLTRRQQLIVNFQILMHFHAFVSLSIMPSSGIRFGLPAPLNCCFILHSLFIYYGQSLCSKRRFLRAIKVVVKKFPWASPQIPILLSRSGAMPSPRLFRLEPLLISTHIYTSLAIGTCLQYRLVNNVLRGPL